MDAGTTPTIDSAAARPDADPAPTIDDEPESGPGIVLSCAAPSADADDPEALAAQLGAMRIENAEMRTIVYGGNRLQAGGVMRIDTTQPEMAHAAFNVRLGAAEKEWLYRHDIGFESMMADTPDASDDTRLRRFNSYIETNALDVGPVCGVTLRAQTLDGRPLRCVRPVGASATGWLAMLAATEGGAVLLYYVRDTEFVQQQASTADDPAAMGHYRWRALDPADRFDEHAARCVAIGGHYVAVADAVRKLLIVYDLTRPGLSHRLRLADHAMPVQLAVAPGRVALMTHDGMVLVLWLDDAAPRRVGEDSPLVAHAGFGRLQFTAADGTPSAAVAATNGALGMHGDVAATPSALAMDQLDDTHLVVGSAEGLCAAFDLSKPGELRVVDQWQMYESGRAGVHHAEALVSRRPWADGCLMALSAASIAVRCPQAIKSAMAGAAARYAALYEPGTESVMCAQLCGTIVVAHKASEGAVLLGSLVPFKDGTTKEHLLRSRVRLAHAIPCKPSAVARYHSVYAEIEHASVLLHTGDVVRVQLAR